MDGTRTALRWSSRFARRTRGEVGGGLSAILALSGATDLISFSGGFPDPSTLPGPVLADLLAGLFDAGDRTMLEYAPVVGLPGTRAFVRDRLATLQGQAPEDGELLITSGTIEALELIAKSFVDPGDVVAVEAPTYLGAIMAFRSFEATTIGLRMDDEGLDVADLEARLGADPAPKLLYTIPDHQNPTGLSLSPERRASLVALARTHGMLIVEDVAYRELGFGDETAPSLWALGPDVTVQCGTFSKTFFPGVRLGWAVGPADVVAQLAAAKQNTDQCAGALGQRLLEEYGRRGLLEEQNVRAKELYARRWGVMRDALELSMPKGVEWTDPSGGFFSWLTLPASIDTAELARAALARGVAFVPGADFFPEIPAPRNRLRLSYSRVPDERIADGIRVLADLIAEVR
jgi:2-aminoadipate transaminase